MTSPHPDSDPRQAGTAPPEPRRILIVDDEVGFTRLLQMNLDKTGRYVALAENDPDQAVSTAVHFKPDLVLMDVMMPHTDGGDLARMFQDHVDLRKTPIIFLTAAVRRSEVAHNDGQFGGYHFMAKPVDMRELLEHLDRHFGTAI